MQKQMKRIIKRFIKENFGKCEAENPAYDLDALVGYVMSYMKPKDRYMVMSGVPENNNLEVLDFNLSEKAAERLAIRMLDKTESIVICRHGEFDYM